MNPVYIPLITAIVLGLFGLGGGIWAFRKNKADATKAIVDSAMALVQEYKDSLKESIEKNEKIIADQKIIIGQAKEAENRAIKAEGKVDELEKTVTYLRERIEEGKKDREELHEKVGMLESQLESLGFTPRSKLERTRSTDKIKKGEIKK